MLPVQLISSSRHSTFHRLEEFAIPQSVSALEPGIEEKDFEAPRQAWDRFKDLAPDTDFERAAPTGGIAGSLPARNVVALLRESLEKGRLGVFSGQHHEQDGITIGQGNPFFDDGWISDFEPARARSGFQRDHPAH